MDRASEPEAVLSARAAGPHRSRRRDPGRQQEVVTADAAAFREPSPVDPLCAVRCLARSLCCRRGQLSLPARSPRLPRCGDAPECCSVGSATRPDEEAPALGSSATSRASDSVSTFSSVVGGRSGLKSPSPRRQPSRGATRALTAVRAGAQDAGRDYGLRPTQRRAGTGLLRDAPSRRPLLVTNVHPVEQARVLLTCTGPSTGAAGPSPGSPR